MLVARSLLTWAVVFVWTLTLAALVSALSLLSLGRLRRRIASAFAPVWVYPLFWAAGIRLEVRGAERLAARRPRVMVMNHASYLDELVACALGPPGFCPMVKSELRWFPVLGQVFWLLGGQFVDRADRGAARGQTDRLRDAVRDEALTAVIAPEGTRSKDGSLGPFKLGALRVAQETGAELLPLVVHGAHALMPPGDWRIRPGVLVAELMPARVVAPNADLRAEADALRADYIAWLAAP